MEDYTQELDQQVTRVNDILTQIRDLNESIRNADLRGDPGLELRDNRNLLLDELSGYMKIDVKYSMEDVGAGTMVEKLTITLANDPPHNHTLVDGTYATKLQADHDDNFRISLDALKNADGEKQDPADPDSVKLLDNDLYGLSAVSAGASDRGGRVFHRRGCGPPIPTPLSSGAFPIIKRPWTP